MTICCDVAKKAMTETKWTAEAVVARLEAAGRTALSMPRGYYGPNRSVTMGFDIVRDAAEAYGWNVAPLRVTPSAAAISEMEAAWDWLNMIDKRVVKQIVALRSLVHPVREHHVYSWRKLGNVIGAHHQGVQRWHHDGIKIIILGLDKRSTRI
jgi:hypothetical protein